MSNTKEISIEQFEFVIESLKTTADKVTIMTMDYYIISAGIMDSVVPKMKEIRDSHQSLSRKDRGR